MTALAGTDWKKEWFEIEDATYLNTAAHTVMPRVSIRAVERSLEAKKFPHRVHDSLWFEAPVRIRSSLAKMIGAKPEKIAVTTGASAGAAVVAHGLEWKRGDEIITVQREFPLQYATWKPMEEREGVRLRVIAPRDRFITADDLIDALTPRTRIVSVSLVRYDDGSLLDATRLAAACHAQGALLLLDVSQACGAVPMNVNDLGADFMVCAAYKWLLSCYGTGFFWVKSEHLDRLRPMPFYWTGQNTDNFSELNFVDPKVCRDAKRWDAAEWATYYNFNLSAMAESVDFVLRTGPQVVAEHNRNLIEFMFSRLPKDHCVPASPLDSDRRGPFGCFTARQPGRHRALPEAAAGKHHSEPAGGQDSGLTLSIQLGAGHRSPCRCGVRLCALCADRQSYLLSGRLAKKNGKPFSGKVGQEITTAEGRQAARDVAIELLATLHGALHDLNRVKRIVRLLVLVNSAPGFTEPHEVADGASELFLEVFGERGAHARSAFGAAQIPFGSCLEIEIIVEVSDSDSECQV